MATDAAGQKAIAFRAVIVDRFTPTSLSASTTPARDRTKPYRFVTTGTLDRGNPQNFRDECRGTVAVTYTAAGRSTTRLAPLTAAGTYRTTFTTTRRGSVTAQASFQGNSVFNPRGSGARTVRAG